MPGDATYQLGASGLDGLVSDQREHFRSYASQYPELALPFGLIGHDAAAAAVRDGRIVFAVEEERLTRSKHFVGFPRQSLELCRAAMGASIAGDAPIAYALSPRDEHLPRRLTTISADAGAATRASAEADYRAVQRRFAELQARLPWLVPIEHHRAHAASAFYPSGFERALVLVVDGYGESLATSLYLGDERGLHPLLELPIDASLGGLYALMTGFLGFDALEDEYKVMGLAGYGTADEFRDYFDRVIQQRDDGSFVVADLHETPVVRLSRWRRAFGRPRAPGESIQPRHIALAASLQRAVERVILRLVERYERTYATRHLCISGGVGLNCTLNGVLDHSGLFDELFVQPAAGDAGTALGAALSEYHRLHPDAPRRRMDSVYLGPGFDEPSVARALASFGGAITVTRPADFTGAVADALAGGEVVAWFHGRMEFGPRALGNRSILADPRRVEMRDHVNALVKKREEFRPFAPSVLADHADELFELRRLAQYEHMTIAVKVRERRIADIPAVVHVDGTARVQVVRREVNPAYAALIARFGERTGVPVLLNTSFNVRGEPIVCSPDDALRCLAGTAIDCLAIEGHLVRKTG